jgi:AraC-like DNA-binding protein
MGHGLKTLLRTRSVQVSAHRCAAQQPGLTDERGDGRPSLAVARRGAHVHHARGRAAVVETGAAVLYRGDAPFRLSHPFASPVPDLSLVIEFDAPLLEELFGGEPLRRDLGQPLSSASLLAAAQTAHALTDERGEAPAGEERALELLGRAARDLGTLRCDALAPAAAVRLAEAVRERIAAEPAGAHDLASMAAELGCSPFHLSRMFRRVTGLSLRAYRLHVRLAIVLDGLAEGEDDLTALALRAGFADHAHMSNSFKRWAGESPSTARERLRTAGLTSLRKNLQARTAAAELTAR